MEKLKLITNAEYKVFNNRVVRCILHCTIPQEVRPYSNIEIPKFRWESTKAMFTVTAIAKCDPRDNFDEKVGKRIAESKALIKAYNVYKALVKDAIKATKSELEAFENFEKKVLRVKEREIEHLVCLEKTY